MNDHVKVRVLKGPVTGTGIDGTVIDAQAGDFLMIRLQSLDALKDKVELVAESVLAKEVELPTMKLSDKKR